MHKYRLVAKKGEGTFSEVLKAQCIKNGKYVAIKCMKNHFDSLDQVNNLREIQALRRLSPHAHIIKLLEVLYDQPTGRLALVFELMDMNIYELIRGRRHYVAEDRIRNYMYQLMKAMDHMHRNGIFHRDIKPENILIMDDCLKLADFGSCRGIYSKQPYTEYISTRWYRAPECLLTDGYYNYKMDMWGVGCVFFEIMALFPLFPGTNELDQIQKIHNILGTPPPELLAKMKKRSQHMDFNFPTKEGTGIAKLIPHVAPDCVDLIIKLLAYNPDDRLSARQALRHPYFRELRDAEKRQKAMMNPEPSGLSAQPSVASQLGIGVPVSGVGIGGGNHGGNHGGDDQLKSARHHGTNSPRGSSDDLQPQHSLGHMASTPSGSTRASDAAGSLPSISKSMLSNQSYAHAPLQQPMASAHHNHGGHGAHGGYAHSMASHAPGGMGGIGGHHMTLQPHHGGAAGAGQSHHDGPGPGLGVGGGHAHAVGVGLGLGVGSSLGGYGRSMVQQHGLGQHGAAAMGMMDVGADDGPLEVSNSAYRLHAESSMDAMSQLHSEGGLPPISSLSIGSKHVLGGGAAARRGQLPAAYGGGGDASHGAVAAGVGYGRGTTKASLAAKRQVVAQQKFGVAGTAAKPGAGMLMQASGVVGGSTIMGHKMAPIVPGGGQQGVGDGGGGGYSKYSKTGGAKTVHKPYVSPYSLRQLGKD